MKCLDYRAEMLRLRDEIKWISEETDTVCDFDGPHLREMARKAYQAHRERVAMAEIDHTFGARWYTPRWLPQWAFRLLRGYERTSPLSYSQPQPHPRPNTPPT